MAISVGSKAPDFKLKSADMRDVRLEKATSENTVLLFVPFAFSEVCTAEFCQVTQDLDLYRGLETQVLGISSDSPFALKAWSEKDHIEIELLSDFDGEVAESYGVSYDRFLGYRRVAMRAAFVIDGQGIVRKSLVSEDAREIPDFSEIKSCLERMNRPN